MNTTSKHRRELCPMASKTQANGLSPAYLMVALVLCNSCGAPPPAAARKAIVQTDATLEAPADRETGDSTSEDSGRATDPTPSQTPWPTPTPSTYPEPSPTPTPSVSPTPTPTPTPTPVPTPVPTQTPTQTPTPTPPPPSLNLGSKFPAQRDESLIATCSADFSGMAEIGGTEVDDVLDGTASSERVVGRGGNDTVRGNDGDDFVSGNIGNDQVNGNMGADQVRGGQGDDVAMGGAGNDCVYGDLGNDQVIGGGGNDSLQGGDGSDVLWPRSQTRDPALDCTDPTFASCTVDWLAGEEGDDTYMVGDGDGRVVILPDTMGTNTLRCTSASAIATSDEGSDRYLLGSGFVIRIVGYHSGLSPITLQDCD